MGKRIPVPTFTCAKCGKTVARKKVGNPGKERYNYKTKLCSWECQHDAQRTGSLDKNGYRYRCQKGRQIFQHREVMEKSIGRTLSPHETVHHINGERADNRIENLELWNNRHGKGQRVSDKLKFASDLLSEYGCLPMFTANDFAMAVASGF